MKQKALVWILWKNPDSPEQKVLLLKVKPERGNVWQPVTGSIENGESFEDGAMREAQEETGFSFENKVHYLGIEHKFSSRFGPAVERCYALWVKGDTPPTPILDPKEHTAFEWVSPEDARSRLPNLEHQKEALFRATNKTPPLFLSKNGAFFQEGEEITHTRTAQLLHKNLTKGEDGNYRVVIDNENLEVICEDVGRFVRYIDMESGTITLMDGRKESLNPANCFVGEENIFYCVLKNGEKAKFLSSAYYEIARAITELSDNTGNRQYFLHFHGRDYEILVS